MTRATDLLARAVDNNIEWCTSVSGGGSADEEVGLWRSDGRPPPLYPDAITRRPNASAEQVAEAVSGRTECSIKDSFADVGLAPFGFRELFAASWIGRDPDATIGAAGWSTVTDPAGLRAWCTAADLPEPLPSALLDDPAVRILALTERGRIVGGAIVNRSSDVVGLSNVFHPDGDGQRIWTHLGAAIAQHFSGLPVVGYEHGPDLAAATGAGFRELGPLRIWIRSLRSSG